MKIEEIKEGMDVNKNPLRRDGKGQLVKKASSKYFESPIRNPIPQFIENKKIFPFAEGVNRLLFVLWLIVSLFIEVGNWRFYYFDKLNSQWFFSTDLIDIVECDSIGNYGIGVGACLLIAMMYLVFLWVYRGFCKEP